MQLMIQVPQNDLTRQELLLVAMKRAGVSFELVSKILETTRANARKLILADRAPTWRVNALIKAGFPPELLPEPLDIAPGPKPRSRRRFQESEPN